MKKSRSEAARLFMRSTILLLVFTLIWTTALFSELPEKDTSRIKERKLRDKYLSTGSGLSWMKSRDGATSPLLYRGLTLPFSVGYIVHSEKIIKTFETDFSYGMLKTRTETPWYDPVNESYYLALRGNLLYRIKSVFGNRAHLYAGPELNLNGHFRVNYKYGNSAFTFDSHSGIGIATRLEYPFGYKKKEFKILGIKFRRRDRDLRLSWQLSMPLVSMAVRPSYVTISHFIAPELRTKLTRDLITFGFLSPVNIRSQTELYYILHNNNVLRLTYLWNFTHFNPDYNKIQSAFHAIVFSFVFKFNPDRKNDQ